MPRINQNYFQLFDIPQSFEVDREALAEKYRGLQNEAHPDRFAGKGEEAKMQAVQFTSYINEAYTTLKSPLKRAAYLLQLHDLETEQVNQQDLDMALLMEQMQLREKLAELPDDDSALDELAAMKKQTQSRIADREQSFSQVLTDGELQKAKEVFHELQFLYKLKREIDEGEEQRLDY